MMIKKLAAALVLGLSALGAFAAVDVNKGSAAELDALPGVGPAMSQRIVDARKQGEFKDWPDLMARVKGIKAKSAAKLSAAGMTVGGKPFDGANAPAKEAAGKKK
ncbi:helix-hairpin-helix domain-containing protein [uncultured Pseudacidovorax sp.]|uniref:ComEA family DNA-binding protein n=1 Tax=uncultured Pseudacidovorax sp. TaxID=679313 RepID=UPI00344D4D6D